jgi:hypothetical protein
MPAVGIEGFGPSRWSPTNGFSSLRRFRIVVRTMSSSRMPTGTPFACGRVLYSLYTFRPRQGPGFTLSSRLTTHPERKSCVPRTPRPASPAALYRPGTEVTPRGCRFPADGTGYLSAPFSSALPRLDARGFAELGTIHSGDYSPGAPVKVRCVCHSAISPACRLSTQRGQCTDRIPEGQYSAR